MRHESLQKKEKLFTGISSFYFFYTQKGIGCIQTENIIPDVV